MKRLNSNQNLATIIIVHGAFEHAGRYHSLAESFQKGGFNVIYGDLPGQGLAEGKKGHIKNFETYIDTVRQWLQKADSSRPVFLLGHSMGGTVVMRVMQELKPSVNGVILSSPAAGILNGASKSLEAVTHVINKVWPSVLVKAPFKPEYVTRNPEVIAKDKQDTLIIEKVSIRWYKEFRKAIKKSFSEVEEFPDVPLLVMQAGEDHMVDPEKTREWFHKVGCQEKTYKEWPGFYHEIFNEPEQEDVYNFALNFIHFQVKQADKEEL
ncbi:alpha/beta hydrolase [Halobacillus halophilus]|uniref:Alpha/beta fold hydrolase n=1 Tax=Halobacillus halophilus (strain ATCC 35676 / DSM 2266 / JCM 20832 / KCTC 3685 / LMG 17431 / NBRC 102448 / NCIMB 2269) TaxID=866895 RepID=I0JPX4_HALH3|nr:alpha/beta hydrolase [Halobacillus halophilus]ASF40218.1 alpha/beta hydrolase [Halobacillus halophilus]CCG46194.1 alpha/beta fold hydrolase [Halobacillus halophilus DSM 2266]